MKRLILFPFCGHCFETKLDLHSLDLCPECFTPVFETDLHCLDSLVPPKKAAETQRECRGLSNFFYRWYQKHKDIPTFLPLKTNHYDESEKRVQMSTLFCNLAGTLSPFHKELQCECEVVNED